MTFINKKIPRLIISFLGSLFLYLFIIILLLYYISINTELFNSEKVQNKSSDNSSLIVDILSKDYNLKIIDSLNSIKTMENIVNSSSNMFDNNEILSIRKIILETKVYLLDKKDEIREIKKELSLINREIESKTKKYKKIILSKEEIKNIKTKYIIELLKLKPETLSRKSTILYLKTKSIDELISVAIFDNEEFFLMEETKLKNWFEEIKTK